MSKDIENHKSNIIIIIFNIKCHMKSKLNNLNTHIIKIRMEQYPYVQSKKKNEMREMMVNWHRIYLIFIQII